MFIIASKPGQLGNRLFQFAYFIACAAEEDIALANPAFDEYAEYFTATRDDLFCRYPPRRSALGGSAPARKVLYDLCYFAARVVAKSPVKLKSLRALVLDWEESVDLCAPTFLSAFARRKIVFFQGWQFNCHAALARRADTVREFFRPLPEFGANVDALVARARAACDVLVGVHIRHGDYRTYRGGKYFYEVGTYAGLMRASASLFPGRRVGFLICSNAAHDDQAFAGLDHVFGTGHLIEDLYALARCDYLFGPPSTYTMWASFYGGVPLYMVDDPGREPRPEDFNVFGVGQDRVA